MLLHLSLKPGNSLHSANRICHWYDDTNCQYFNASCSCWLFWLYCLWYLLLFPWSYSYILHNLHCFVSWCPDYLFTSYICFRVILNQLKVSSMMTLLISLIFGTIGCFLLIDWPYLLSFDNTCNKHSNALEFGSDICDSGSATDNLSMCFPLSYDVDMPFDIHYCTNQPSNISVLSDTTILFISSSERCQDDSVFKEMTYNQLSGLISVNLSHINIISLTDSINASYLSIHKLLEDREQCLSNDQCYWNPKSIVTGTCCDTCPSLCHKRNTLPFVQLCASAIILSVATILGRYIVQPLMEKMSPISIQVLIFECMAELNWISHKSKDIS